MTEFRLFLSAVAASIALAATGADARNVDLATVPERATVQLTVYNSEDLTLVRETRLVSFKQGSNRLQFSWANTLIDPTSVRLRFLTRPERLTVLDTTFPHRRPEALYWTVESEIDGAARVEITYFTSGITWSADYVMVASRTEADASLESFVRIHNGSGEAYENAQVRVVVGTINLVEKIARLARVAVADVSRLDAERKGELRAQVARKAMSVASAGVVSGPAMPREKQVIKEGLSEYFIYTIEGRETIPDGWSKRLRSFAASEVPLEIRYRYWPRVYGDRLVRVYRLRNDGPSGLGTTPLPNGVVRVFRDNGRDGLGYLSTQSIDYVPVGDRIEVNLGPDPRVRFDLVKLRSHRENLWLKLRKGKEYRRVEDGMVALDRGGTVAGWDQHRLFAQRVRNTTPRPVRIDVRHRFDGDVEFSSRLGARNQDFRTVEFDAVVAPFTKRDLLFATVRREGRNAKQSRVVVRERRVGPAAF